MFGLSFFEMSVIGIIAVVLFGGNLPEVARKFGHSYSQLRRSLHDVQQQFREAQRDVDRAMAVDNQSKSNAKAGSYDEDEDDTPEPSAPKFTPPS
ncbi:Sec-independent protein translocase subunit TatA/TatB [Allorhodopirellula heiligendammensis]|uniref:Sec-independent translocase n=1 Tax=Allorhodopirellula heiligendammensis TaxID=2714739 RepID=A0A5C6C4U5_9BACT|nr:twin-arginine translocase TatA/TatE family subunit [Allorhodopirellula heiligendammensis]TWU18354.1 sec-independent translocase [Allorhodopirellula heiligendammensis]|tara:strand:+ start:813 stop:1097 length:285 start_codon:yes stop_codon:yes gene_type:complete